MKNLLSFPEFKVRDSKPRQYDLEVGAKAVNSTPHPGVIFNILRLAGIAALVALIVLGAVVVQQMQKHHFLGIAFGTLAVAYLPLLARRMFRKPAHIQLDGSFKVSVNGAVIKNGNVMRNGKNLNGERDILPQALIAVGIALTFATLLSFYLE